MSDEKGEIKYNSHNFMDDRVDSHSVGYLHCILGTARVLLGEFEQHFFIKELVDGDILAQALHCSIRIAAQRAMKIKTAHTHTDILATYNLERR